MTAEQPVQVETDEAGRIGFDPHDPRTRALQGKTNAFEPFLVISIEHATKPRKRDQGIGISEEDQQQLFKAFHRGGNVGARPGTGLGLLLVKRCADLHGGELQLNSTVGQGTTVTVRLPVFGRNHEKDIGH